MHLNQEILIINAGIAWKHEHDAFEMKSITLKVLHLHTSIALNVSKNYSPFGLLQ